MGFEEVMAEHTKALNRIWDMIDGGLGIPVTVVPAQAEPVDKSNEADTPPAETKPAKKAGRLKKGAPSTTAVPKFSEIQALAVAAIEKHNLTIQVRALFKEYGANKLTDLNTDALRAKWAEIKGLLEALIGNEATSVPVEEEEDII